MATNWQQVMRLKLLVVDELVAAVLPPIIGVCVTNHVTGLRITVDCLTESERPGSQHQAVAEMISDLQSELVRTHVETGV